MIGLVNSVGASVTARLESVSRASRDRAVEPNNQRLLLLNNEAAAYQVLNTAIKAMDEAFNAVPERHLPTGDESDRFNQAETEQGNSTLMNSGHVDVVA